MTFLRQLFSTTTICNIADKIVYAPIYMVMFLEKSNVAPLYIKRTFPDYK